MKAFKNSLFILSFALIPTGLVFARGQEQLGRYLEVERLPTKVQRAVSEVTYLGRDYGDFFGFEVVESYRLLASNAEPRLKKIIAAVIEASRRHGEYSVADFCVNGSDQEGRTLQFDDDYECAAYIAGYTKRPMVHEMLSDLSTSFDQGSKEQRRMSSAAATLKGFIADQVGQDFEEFNVSMTGLNVSQNNIILINKKTGHVLVIKYNEGA